MGAPTAQVVGDLTISASGETATGSGIYKVTALPTAGVESSRPDEVTFNATSGVDLYFTGRPPLEFFTVGKRFILGLDSVN